MYLETLDCSDSLPLSQWEDVTESTFREACAQTLGTALPDSVSAVRVTGCENTGFKAFVRADVCCACPDPDAPEVQYISQDPDLCRIIRFFCPPGATLFSNACGCGCLIEPPSCQPDSPRAVTPPLHYPGRSCAAATEAAEEDNNRTSLFYRQACQRSFGGDLPEAVLDATVVDCRQEASGAWVRVEACCPGPTDLDLEIEKLPAGDFFWNQPAQYTLQVKNVAPAGGNTTTGGIVVVDTLPSYMRPAPESGSFTVPGWLCEVAGQDISCTYSGPPLSPGEAAPPIILTFQLIPDRNVSLIANCATVETPADGNPANNTSCHATPVLWAPDLRLTKTLERNYYEITVNNLVSGSTTGSLQVTDNLPPDLEFDFHEGDGWTCVNSGRRVVCTHPGPLAGRETTTLRIYITGSVREGRRNCARVDTKNDFNLDNNTACDCPDPDDPKVHYISRDPAECQFTFCRFWQASFSNACGCGCIDTRIDPPYHYDWQLAPSIFYSRPSGGGQQVEGEGDFRLENSFSFDPSFGLGFILERRLSRRLGIELAALRSEPEFEVEERVSISGFPPRTERASAGLSFVPVTLEFKVHLTPDRPTDFTIGPLLGYGFFGSTTLFGEPVAPDDAFLFGAQLGVAVPLGERPWTLLGDLRFLRVETDLGGVPLDFDWPVLSFGIGRRF